MKRMKKSVIRKLLLLAAALMLSLSFMTAAEAKTVKGKQWAGKVYLTGDAKTDYVLECIAQNLFKKPGKYSKYDMLKIGYNYVSSVSMHYDHAAQGKIRIDTTSPKAKKAIQAYRTFTKNQIASGKAVVMKSYNKRNAYGMITRGSGDCYASAYAYQMLMGHVGIDSIVMGTLETGSTYWSTRANKHSWNMVKMGKKYYFVDTDCAAANGGSLTWFLFGRNTAGAYLYDAKKVPKLAAKGYSKKK